MKPAIIQVPEQTNIVTFNRAFAVPIENTQELVESINQGYKIGFSFVDGFIYYLRWKENITKDCAVSGKIYLEFPQCPFLYEVIAKKKI